MAANGLIRYFDLQSARRSEGLNASPDHASPDNRQSFPVFWQYVALVFGITAQPFLGRYSESRIWDLHGFAGWFFFAIFVAIIIFPAVYKTALDAATQHLFVQCCAIFAGGIGWQSLLMTVGKGLANYGNS
jgi:hypothetical protein